MAAKAQTSNLGARALDTSDVCETLKRALIGRDAELAASLYSDDVEIVVVNRNYPPSQPFVRRGRQAALELWQDICGREMTHSVTATVVGENSFAIRESCMYADGGRVVGHVIAELRDGRIARHFSVDCWDE
jgi:ketosteroid isomerase-like protein